MRHVRAIIERSGRFWMVIQRKEKWKKINKVQYSSERGHDKLGRCSYSNVTKGCYVTVGTFAQLGLGLLSKYTVWSVLSAVSEY